MHIPELLKYLSGHGRSVVRAGKRCHSAFTNAYERREEFLVLLFLVFIVWACFMLYSLDAYGQSKFFSTPNRGGADGAKSQAILQMLMNENAIRKGETTANAASVTTLGAATDASITALKAATDASLTTIGNCGTQGMMFGPGHAHADGNDCIQSFQVVSDGNVLFQAGAKFGTSTLCDPTTAGTIRYNGTAKRMEFCNGDVWGMLGGNTGCSINFPAVSDASLDTFYDTTDAIYSGTTTTASVNGATPAVIRRNGSNTGMVSGVTVNQGNSVGIRGKSAPQFNQTANFTLDIGAYTACWQITTKQQDVLPNAFSFNSLTGQDLDTLVVSNSVTVNGFDGPLTVSVSGQGGPQLKIGGGSWATSGQINPGDSLTLRVTTSPNYETSYSISLGLGAFSTSWNVTTKPDCVPGSFVATSCGTVYTVNNVLPTCSITADLSASGSGGRWCDNPECSAKRGGQRGDRLTYSGVLGPGTIQVYASCGPGDGWGPAWLKLDGVIKLQAGLGGGGKVAPAGASYINNGGADGGHGDEGCWNCGGGQAASNGWVTLSWH
ncbi:MAG: hypothetical protein GC134_08020 [Proteobacteria bacterium]|nr:hypothetical protein [Pseudomonadota bacterium]